MQREATHFSCLTIRFFIYTTMVLNVCRSNTVDGIEDLKLPGLVHLTTSTFDELVTEDSPVWLVEFVIPKCGPCQMVLPELNKTIEALKGIAKVGIVNVREDRKLSERFEIVHFPTFRILIGRIIKNYRGTNDAKHLTDAVLYHISEKVRYVIEKHQKGSKQNVKELTELNFDDEVLKSKEPWLVMFYAPWCGHCKNFKPAFYKAAAQLKGIIRMGALDATVHGSVADKYEITGYPTVKYFPAGDKKYKTPIDYTGGRLEEHVVEWVTSRVAEDTLPPKMTQIIGREIFEEHCINKTLCVILFVADLLDCSSSCRNNHLKMLDELGNEFRTKNWGWLWSEPNIQTDLEKTLDIGGFGYPALVVLNSKKMRFSCFRGSFNKKSIREFLNEISSVKVRTEPLRDAKLPEIFDVLPWDGSDGPKINLEEEAEEESTTHPKEEL